MKLVEIFLVKYSIISFGTKTKKAFIPKTAINDLKMVNANYAPNAFNACQILEYI